MVGAGDHQPPVFRSRFTGSLPQCGLVSELHPRMSGGRCE